MTGAVSRGLSRAPAARFRPRINLRSQAGIDLLKYGPMVVVRYGVLPDGSEISLGRTVDRNLSESINQYWGWLYLSGAFPAIPRVLRGLAFRAFRKFWTVEVKGYEMTPLPPLE